MAIVGLLRKRPVIFKATGQDELPDRLEFESKVDGNHKTPSAAANRGKRESEASLPGKDQNGARWERGNVRIGFLRSVPQLLREFALDPVEQLAPLGFVPGDFERDDREVAYEDAVGVLAHCARVADCPHFGARVGARFDPVTFGETASLMLECPSVGAALKTFVLRHHLLDCGAVVTMDVGARRTKISYYIYTRLHEGRDLALDIAMAIGIRILEMLCGNSWRPLRVSLAHGEPANAGPYHEVFGPNVEFNAPSTDFTFVSSWLDEGILHDPALHARLSAAASSVQPVGNPPFGFMVRRALRPLIFTGRANVAHAARLFSMHVKTFVRRLDSEGLRFQDLLNEARHGMALELLYDTNLSIGTIAASLQYAHHSGFTNAFRARSGVSPSEWRIRSQMRRE